MSDSDLIGEFKKKCRDPSTKADSTDTNHQLLREYLKTRGIDVDNVNVQDPEFILTQETIDKGKPWKTDMYCIKQTKYDKENFPKWLKTFQKHQDELKNCKGNECWKSQIDGYSFKGDVKAWCSTDPNTILPLAKKLQTEHNISIKNQVPACNLITGIPIYYRELTPEGKEILIEQKPYIDPNILSQAKETPKSVDKKAIGIIRDQTTEFFIPTDTITNTELRNIEKAIDNDEFKPDDNKLVTYFVPRFDRDTNKYVKDKYSLMKKCYKNGQKGYCASIGLMGNIQQLFKEANIDLAIDDQRKLPTPQPFELKKTILVDGVEKPLIIRDYQQNIIDEAKEKGHGIVEIATGGGKTIVASGIISEIGQDTAFIVPNNSLFYNAKQQIGSYVDKDKVNIGQVGGMKVDYKNDPNKVDINIISLPLAALAISNPDAIDPEKRAMVLQALKDANMIIFDECLVGDTNIITQDGELKQINEIKNNDNIIGGNVSNVFQKKVLNTIIIETTFNSIETTETHPNFIIDHLEIDKSHKNYGKFINPTEKDIKIVPSNKLKIGNYLLVINNLPHIQKTNFTEDELYFVAVIMCDGHLDKKGNRTKIDLRIRENLNNNTKISSEFYQKALEIIDPNEKVIVSITNRNNKPYSKVIYSNSKKIRNYLIENFNIPIGKKSELIDINNNIFSANINSIKAFIQGCFDCEGWVQEKRVGFSSTSKQFIDKLQLLLLKFEILANIRIKTLNKLKNTLMYHLDITGDNLIQFNLKIGFKCEYKNDKLKQLIKKLPNRTLSHYIIYNNQKYFLYKIKNIITNNIETDVYDFTTTTHSFIANGFLTHNCHHISADTYKRVAQYAPAKYRFGLSATAFRDDGKTLEIVAGVGGTLGAKIKAQDLIKRGYLTPPEIYVINNEDITPKSESEILANLKNPKCNINPETKMFENIFIKDRIPSSVSSDKSQRFRYIEKGSIECNEPRNERILQLTEQLNEYGKTKVIFVNSVEHGKKLQQMFEEKGIYSEILTGDTESQILKKLEEGKKLTPKELEKEEEEEESFNKKRAILFDKMQKGELKTIIATDKIMGEGVDIPAIDSLILTNMRKSRTAALQMVGRALRKKEGKEKALIFDFRDPNEKLNDWRMERLQTWRNEQFPIKGLEPENVNTLLQNTLGEKTKDMVQQKEHDLKIIERKNTQKGYEALKLPELKQKAKEKGLKITGLKKDEIIYELMR